MKLQELERMTQQERDELAEIGTLIAGTIVVTAWAYLILWIVGRVFG